MDVVRNLPASEAAPALAGPAVRLAVDGRLVPQVAHNVKALADELLIEAAGQGADTIELRVHLEARAVRVEVTTEERVPPGPGVRLPARSREGTIRRLADRWGLTQRGPRRRMWAEMSTPLPDAERRSA